MKLDARKIAKKSLAIAKRKAKITRKTIKIAVASCICAVALLFLITLITPLFYLSPDDNSIDSAGIDDFVIVGEEPIPLFFFPPDDIIICPSCDYKFNLAY